MTNKKYKINYYNLVPNTIQDYYLEELNKELKTDKNLYHFIKRLCSLYTFDFYVDLIKKCQLYKEYFIKGYCDLVFIAFLKANHNSEIDINIMRVFLCSVKKQLLEDEKTYTEDDEDDPKTIVKSIKNGLLVYDIIAKDFNNQCGMKPEKTYIKIKNDEKQIIKKIIELAKQEEETDISNFPFFNVFSPKESETHNKEIVLLEKIPYLKQLKDVLYIMDSEFSIASDILKNQFLYLIERSLKENKDIELYDIDDYLFDNDFSKLGLVNVDFLLNYLALHYFIYGNETKETELVKHLNEFLRFIIGKEDELKKIMSTIKEHQEFLIQYSPLEKLKDGVNHIEEMSKLQEQATKLRVVK